MLTRLILIKSSNKRSKCYKKTVASQRSNKNLPKQSKNNNTFDDPYKPDQASSAKRETIN